MDPWMEVTLFLVLVGVFLGTAGVTLLGIAGKIPVPHRYLGPLVAALLVEGAGVVLTLAGTLRGPDPATDFVQTLPAAVRGATPEETRFRVAALVAERGSLDEADREVAALRAERDRAEARMRELEADDGHFLVRMVRFHRAAQDFGGSLNLTYPPDPRKESLSLSLLELLGELGHYEGPLEPDPDRAREALVEYQRHHGFERVGWYARPTFDVMVADHLAAGLATGPPASTQDSGSPDP